MLSVHLDVFTTLILAIFLFIVGCYIKSKVSFLQKFCIPSPVVSGLLFSVLTLFLKVFNICTITIDTFLMDYFISIFFTIIGLSISFSLVKKGGFLLIKYWLLCGVLAYIQNFISLILSKPLDIHPLLGLMCGTISMVGGHGYSAAFGSTIESLGVENAISVGITAATLGLILSGLIGAPLGKYLIEKYKLGKINHNNFNKNVSMITNTSLSRSNSLSVVSSLEQILTVLLCVSLGKLLSYIVFDTYKILIPGISGCIIVAVLFRNLNDKINFIKLDFSFLDFINEMFLGVFLTMALMSVDLYKLSNLFGPIVVIVLCQTLFIILFSIFIVFKVLGKNLDSAIIISGLIGHCIGSTPVALANMSSLSGKYGYSEKAFLVVPLVAAFLLDIFTMPSIIYFINLLS